MKLVAEYLTGSLFHVEVADDATVADLKDKIGNQENLPRDRLILMLYAAERHLLLNDEAALKDYGVQDSSRIYIFFQNLPDEGTLSSPTPEQSTPNEPPPPSTDVPGTSEEIDQPTNTTDEED